MRQVNENKALHQWLSTHAPHHERLDSQHLEGLAHLLRVWAGHFYADILDIGAPAKHTDTDMSAQAEWLLSLKPSFSGQRVDDNARLLTYLKTHYPEVKRQGPAVRVYFPTHDAPSGFFKRLSTRKAGPRHYVDIIPARVNPQGGHTLLITPPDVWVSTVVDSHTQQVRASGLQQEIRCLKLWRAANHLVFPTMYLETLLLGRLLPEAKTGFKCLATNVYQAIMALASVDKNPLYEPVDDISQANNRLSSLITDKQRRAIQKAAQKIVDADSLHSMMV